MKANCFFPVSRDVWRVFWVLIPVLAAGVSAVAQTRTVTITKADCSRLAYHVPSNDTAYRPGIDVHGKPVVPADLGGTPEIKLPEEITSAITVDIQERFSIPANSTLFEPEAYIGNVVVHKDGATFFNGKPLTSEEQRALAHLCQRQAKKP